MKLKLIPDFINHFFAKVTKRYYFEDFVRV